MDIKTIVISDIPKWVSLSKEYDKYVLEIVPSLTEWYEGNDISPSFNSYMLAKINKGEAFMAIDKNGDCLGIIAISIANNRITFFGVSHKQDFYLIGKFLLEYAMAKLNPSLGIRANVIKSAAEQIRKEYELFAEYGFTHMADDLENGVPVMSMEKRLVHTE